MNSVADLETACTALTGADAIEGMAPGDRLKMPAHLYLVGDVALLNAPLRVAVIGTRTPTPGGVLRAERLVRELVAQGAVIVSGLAAGVDTVAHRTAIARGGRTIAVLGLPISQVYPPENRELQRQIGAEHLLVSQFADRSATSPKFFVQRNRTMALLAHATVIVEAGDSSGTLSQAAETMRLGRPLFFLRSSLERSDLRWPARFANKGAVVLDRSAQVSEALCRTN